MKKLLLILLFVIFLSGCNGDVNIRPATETINLNLPKRTELDLSQYKVWFKYESDEKVCVSMEEIRKINELHVILLNRMRLDDVYIREYQKFYESPSK